MRSWRSSRLWATRYCDHKHLSSAGAPSQEQKESSNEPTSEKANQTVYVDFNAFREAVDRAVARDPYGTLFGRRLESPPSVNNSSWTSFSWFTDSKEIKDDARAPSTQAKPSVTATAPTEKPGAPASTRHAQETVKQIAALAKEMEYEFDPISMRKVPKKHIAEVKPVASIASEKPSPTSGANKPSSQTELKKQPSDNKPKQPFLQSLFFAEHGVDIPVKTFKPHKVYGYGVPDKKPIETSADKGRGMEKDFDTSRKQKMRDLMSRVKGNNIDTTALFTELHPNPELAATASEATPLKKPSKPRLSPEPDDSLPLFSGTAYESRGNKEAPAKSSDWLAKEGFRQPVNTQSPAPAAESAADILIKKHIPKLQPALDRVHVSVAQETNDKSARLQTALDRQHSLLKREYIKTAEQEKTRRRAQLRADFEARHRNAANETDFTPRVHKAESSASKMNKTIENVWEHIREHPNGIVARTMKSMTSLNENYKKYIRPDAVKGLTDKLLFKDEALSKTPSIYKQNTTTPKVGFVTPSYGLLEAQREQEQRSASLKASAEKIRRDEEVQKAQVSRLAGEIQAVYESEYGLIDSNHRQVTPTTDQTPSLATSTPPVPDQQVSGKPHPLSTASVKPGVTTNPAIDHHIKNFEPKLAKIVDVAKIVHSQLRNISAEAQQLRKPVPTSAPDAKLDSLDATSSHSTLTEVFQGTKEVRKALHETKRALRHIGTGTPVVAWIAPQMSGSDFGRKRIDINGTRSSEPTGPNPVDELIVNSEKTGQAPSQASEEAISQTIPKAAHTPAGSSTWDDEQIPPIEELRAAKFDSPYLILLFDPSTKKVTVTPMNQPSQNMPQSANVVHILGRLKNASEFLKHFQTLQAAGYSIFNGTTEMLIFQKDQPAQAITPVVPLSTTQGIATKPTETPMGTKFVTQTSDEAPTPRKDTATVPQEAATVLEKVPTELDPPPGPAAPTAPLSRSFKNKSKMRRQEKVFSGTIQPNAATSSSKILASKTEASQTEKDYSKTKARKQSLWGRFTRAIRRTILTVTAVAAGAYTIGFVADGLGAHAQQQKSIENGDTLGPRKRIVYPNQRAGIYSTESSR